MTLPQIVSLVATILLTTVASIIGVQIILILKDIRHTFSHVSRAVDTTENTLRQIGQPLASFITMLEGLKESSRFLDAFSNFVKKHSSPNDPIDITAPDPLNPPHFD